MFIDIDSPIIKFSCVDAHNRAYVHSDLYFLLFPVLFNEFVVYQPVSLQIFLCFFPVYHTLYFIHLKRRHILLKLDSGLLVIFIEAPIGLDDGLYHFFEGQF